jgi:hypothetical protein
MKLLDALLKTLRRGEVVRDVRLGPFQTAVLTGNCGIAATPYDYVSHHEKRPVREAGELLGKDALAVARLVDSSSLLEAAIGMATLNSLLDIDEERCLNLNGRDLLIEKSSGKRLALVGHFPFVPELRQKAKELWVIERRPREGDFSESEAEKLIPQADVVGITGTAFTNHTIEYLLSLRRPGAYVVVLGGTAPLSPVLFDYGVDAVCGTKVVDLELVLRCVSQGATFPQLKGVLRLTLLK